MAIVGDLTDLGVSDLLYMFKMRGLSGTLVVRNGDDDATLQLQQGRLVSVSSSMVWQRLGELLVHAGKLTADQLTTALVLRAARPTAAPLGSWLISEGLVSQADLHEVLQCQAEEILLRIIGWGDGTFSFSQEVSSSGAVPLPEINIEQIIFEAVRQSDETTDLHDRIPDLNRNAIVSDLPVPGQGESLSLKEAFVLRTIGAGLTNLAQVARTTQMADLELARIVDGLSRRGLLTIINPRQLHPTADLPIAPTPANRARRLPTTGSFTRAS